MSRSSGSISSTFKSLSSASASAEQVQLLRLVVPTLGRADGAERRRRSRPRARGRRQGVRPRLPREPLGLVDLAHVGERRGELRLQVGQDAAVAPHARHAHRLAQELLGALVVATQARDPPELGERARDRGLDAELGRRRADLLEERLRRVDLALHGQEPPVRERCAHPRADAAALAGELERPGEQQLRLVGARAG